MLPTESMRRVLDAALANGGDLAEIYLENKESLSLTLDEGRLENATQGNDIGGGVRVFYGNNAAYAYTDDLTEESLMEAAAVASAAARNANNAQVCADLTKRESQVRSRIERPFEQMSDPGQGRYSAADGRGYAPAQPAYRQRAVRVFRNAPPGMGLQLRRRLGRG